MKTSRLMYVQFRSCVHRNNRILLMSLNNYRRLEKSFVNSLEMLQKVHKKKFALRLIASRS